MLRVKLRRRTERRRNEENVEEEAQVRVRREKGDTGGFEELFQKSTAGDAEDGGGGGWEEKIFAHSACPAH